MLDVIQPFLKVPINILRVQTERGPFAPVISLGKVLARKAAGAPLKLDEEIAKNLVAATIAGGTAIATYEGFLTGGVVPNPNRTGLRQLSRASGNIPYSMIIGGTEVPYIFFEPIGPLMAIYADITELSMTYPFLSEDWNRGVLTSFANNISRRSYFESLGVMMDAWRGDWDEAKDGLAFMIVGNAVPFSSSLRQGGEMFDIRRNGKTFVQKLMEQLPVLRNEVPPQRNRWGETIYNADTMVKKVAEWMGVTDEQTLDIANKIGMTFAPLPTLELISNDPVDKSMRILIDHLGPDEKFEMAGGATRRGKISVLSDEDFDAFLVETGQREKEAVREVIGIYGNRFDEAISNEETRQELIGNISGAIESAREEVRYDFLEKYQ